MKVVIGMIFGGTLTLVGIPWNTGTFWIIIIVFALSMEASALLDKRRKLSIPENRHE